MDFSTALIEAKVIKYYRTFTADVELINGDVVTAFCPDRDYFSDFYTKGTEVFVSKNKDESRKIKYDIELVNKPAGLIYVNPACNYDLFIEAFNEGKLFKDFGKYTKARKIKNFDGYFYTLIELSNKKGEKGYAYIVDLYNKQDGMAVFPSGLNFFDMAVFEEHERLRAQGFETYIFMIIPRFDCLSIKFSWALAPSSAAKIFDEAKKGLNFVGYSCIIDKKSVKIADKLEIIC